MSQHAQRHAKEAEEEQLDVEEKLERMAQAEVIAKS